MSANLSCVKPWRPLMGRFIYVTTILIFVDYKIDYPLFLFDNEIK